MKAVATILITFVGFAFAADCGDDYTTDCTKTGFCDDLNRPYCRDLGSCEGGRKLSSSPPDSMMPRYECEPSYTCVQCVSDEDCLERVSTLKKKAKRVGKKTLKKNRKKLNKRFCKNNMCQKKKPECDVVGTNSAYSGKCARMYPGNFPDGREFCTDQECTANPRVAGRPFTVNDEARVADTCGNAAWLADTVTHVQPQNITKAMADKLGNYWSDSGAAEHASVASFARHILQLLSLGAPSHLVELAQAALRDEIEHAKLCYGLATHYLGMPVGPARLDIESALVDSDEESIIESIVREGAVAETLSAYKARHAAAMATDPAVASVLRTIAADEGRHAALAWSTLEWASLKHSALIEKTFKSALSTGLSVAGPVATDEEDLRMLQFGVLTPRVEAELDRVGRTTFLTSTFKSFLGGAKISMSDIIAKVGLHKL